MSVFISARYAAATLNLEFQNSAGTVVRVDKFTACNTDTVAQSLVVNLVTFGDTAGASNQVLSTTLRPGATYLGAEIIGADLENGDSIYVQAGTASKVSIRCNGRTV